MGRKKKMTMMSALLMVALIPTIVSALVITFVAITSMSNALEYDVYHELEVAAEGLRGHYIGDIVNSENHTPEYEHDYVDSLLENNIHLTLFLNDVRYITSIEDSSNSSGRNEGTTADSDIWARVSSGETVTQNNVDINGEKYYVAYVPLTDDSGSVYGMAFAGKEEELVEEEIKSVRTKICIATIIVIIFCTVVVIMVAKNIREPLAIIDKNLELLAEGELKPWKTAKSSIAEIDSIIQSRKRLSTALQNIIETVQHTSEELLTSGNELKAVAANTSTNAEDISHAVEEMAKGAVSMASDIEHANEKVVDMGGKIECIVGGIGDLDNVANGMDVAGKKAMNIIETLDASNAKTAEAIQVVAENVEATDRSVSKISAAVNVITEIADQTNLLALNASIEAARAGEVGKGFAVVANEISSLADQSSDSAKQIGEVLSVLVTDSKRSIEKMEEVKRHLQEQQENLKNTQNEFANVSAGIQDTRNQSDIVDVQAKDCNASRSSVIDIISSLSSISEENAASTEETTASIQELTATINLVAQQANEVQQQAQNLEQAMGFFKL